MIANFGFGVLVLSFLTALYSVFAAIYGERTKNPSMVESARRAMLLTWPLLTLTAGILIYLLVNNHYEVQFVYEVTSRSMPTYLKVTAWWGGQSGSLLFWSWLMSAFASLVTLRKWDRDREFLPWVIVVACITMAFFLTYRPIRNLVGARTHSHNSSKHLMESMPTLSNRPIVLLSHLPMAVD